MPANSGSPLVMTDALFRLNHRVVAAARVISWVAVCALLLVSLAVLGDVTLRWLLNSPIHGLEDVMALVVTVAVSACFPAGFALRANITVHFLGKALGPRAGAWLDAVGHLFAFAFIILVAWQLTVYVADVGNRSTFILGLSIVPAWIGAAAFSILTAVAQGIVLAAHVAGAMSCRAVPDVHGAATPLG